MRRPLLLLAVIIGLLAASLVAIALRPAVLGLDLQGGVEVVLEGQATDTSQVTPEAIERSVEIIRNRVDSFGVAEPEIQTQGDDQIVVALPGADNPEQVVNDLIQPAKLVFINFERNVVEPDGGDRPLRGGPARRRGRRRTRPTGCRPTTPSTSGPSSRSRASPRRRRSPTSGTASRATRSRRAVEVQAVPKGLFIAYEEVQRLQTRDVGHPAHLLRLPEQPGADRRRRHRGAGHHPDRRARQPRPHRHAPVHRRRARRSSPTSRASSPRTGASPASSSASRSSSTARSSRARRSTTTSTRRASTAATAPRSTATSRQGEAETLAKQINSGALPIDLKVVSQKQVSATLGKESLRAGPHRRDRRPASW